MRNKSNCLKTNSLQLFLGDVTSDIPFFMLHIASKLKTMKTTSNPFDFLSAEISDLKKEIQQFEKRENNQSSTQQKLETLLTLAEVLKIFHITRPTLRRWEKKKIISPIRVGRRLLFKVSDIYKLTDNMKGGKQS